MFRFRQRLMPRSFLNGGIRIDLPKITVTIEATTCILAANCVGMEPKLFQIGLEPHVELIDSNGMLHGTEYTFEGKRRRWR
jgi:uncharacterized Fe-S cluster protein YjdI